MEAWADRTAALSAMDGVEQVYCFENRGEEIGVTLHHPHGQIYGFPFVTPRTRQMLAQARPYAARAGRNLFDDLVAAERAEGTRIVAANEQWTAFVPPAARWPYEVLIFPARRVPDLPALDDAARAAFSDLYLDVLRRFDAAVRHRRALHRGVAPGPGQRRRARAGSSGCTCRSSPSAGRPASSSTSRERNPAWASGSTTSLPEDGGAQTSGGRMRLLVTGGAGYIGSVVAASLIEAGHDVTVLDDLSTGHADAVPAKARPSSAARCATTRRGCWPTASTRCCISRRSPWSASR